MSSPAGRGGKSRNWPASAPGWQQQSGARSPEARSSTAPLNAHVSDMLNPLARFALLSRAPGLTPLPAHEPPESTRLVPTFVGFGTVGHRRPINRAAIAACRHWRLSPLLDGGGMRSVYSTQIGRCNLSRGGFTRNGPQRQYWDVPPGAPPRCARNADLLAGARGRSRWLVAGGVGFIHETFNGLSCEPTSAMSRSSASPSGRPRHLPRSHG